MATPIDNNKMAVPYLKNTKYRKDIDAIRAIAVLSVMIFHLNPEWLPGGFLGVDIFFVISGYLITSILKDEIETKNFNLLRFYARRVKRILPAFFTVLSLTMIIATFLFHPESYTNLMKSAKYSSAQVANFFFSQHVGYFEENFSEQPLLHLWTLGVEQQFYLIWPILLFSLYQLFSWIKVISPHPPPEKCNKPRSHVKRNVCLVISCLTLVSFFTCRYLSQSEYNLAFYMFYSRAWEFAIGGLLGMITLPFFRSKKVENLFSIFGILLILFGLVMVGEEFKQQSFLRLGVLFPCLGTVLLISASPRALVNRLISSKVQVFIGKISYSIYLYHWPLIIFSKNFHNGNGMSITQAISLILISIILASISYFVIEQPIRRTNFTDRQILTGALLTMTTFAVASILLLPHDTATWRITKYQTNKRISYPAIPPLCERKYIGSVKYSECRTTDNDNAPFIGLAGDSHAIHFLKSTVSWAQKRGYNVLYLDVPGCPMLLGDIHFESELHPDINSRCQESLPFFASKIVNNDKVDLILIAQRFDLLHNGKGFLSQRKLSYFKDSKGRIIDEHTEYYRAQLRQTIETIREKGKEVVLLKQVPLFPGNKDCHWEPSLKKWILGDSLCAFNHSFIRKWQKPSSDFLDDFSSTHKVSTFDPAHFILSPRKRDRNLYGDIDHLNGNGCHYLIPDFIKEMEKNMKSGNEQKMKIAIRPRIEGMPE